MKCFKKLLPFSCKFISLTAIISASLTVSAAAAEAGFVNSDGAGFRVGPDIRAPLLGHAGENQAVTIHSSHGNARYGTFYRVNIDGVANGVYIPTRYITRGAASTQQHDSSGVTSTSDETQNETPIQSRGVANIPSINIRAGSSTSSAILATANVGDTFTILARVGDWYRISHNSQPAYIFSDFLTITSNDAVAPQVPVSQPPATPPSEATMPSLPAFTQPQPANASAGGFAVPLSAIWDAVDAAEEPDEVPSEASPQVPLLLPLPAPSVPDANPDLPSFANFNFNLENLDVPELSAIPQADAFATVISPTGLNLRESQSTESGVVTTLYPMQTLNVYDVFADWVRVSTLDGLRGYVSYEFVTVRSGQRQAPPEHNPDLARQVIDFARQFIGTPYMFGGTDLSTGVDCSGFVFSVMNEFGIDLGRSSRDMINNGIPVDREDIAPGDLIFFSANGTVVTHVALYMGSGQFIHSTDTRGLGVSFASLSSEHSLRTYFGARRVIE